MAYEFRDWDDRDEALDCARQWVGSRTVPAIDLANRVLQGMIGVSPFAPRTEPPVKIEEFYPEGHGVIAMSRIAIWGKIGEDWILVTTDHEARIARDGAGGWEPDDHADRQAENLGYELARDFAEAWKDSVENQAKRVVDMMDVNIVSEEDERALQEHEDERTRAAAEDPPLRATA